MLEQRSPSRSIRNLECLARSPELKQRNYEVRIDRSVVAGECCAQRPFTDVFANHVE